MSPARDHVGRSADAGWTAARKIRRDNRGSKHMSHVEKLLAPLPGTVALSRDRWTSGALGWSAACGHRLEALGVENFGQTGTSTTSTKQHGMDANAIMTRRRASPPARRCGIARWRCSA